MSDALISQVDLIASFAALGRVRRCTDRPRARQREHAARAARDVEDRAHGPGRAGRVALAPARTVEVHRARARDRKSSRTRTPSSATIRSRNSTIWPPTPENGPISPRHNRRRYASSRRLLDGIRRRRRAARRRSSARTSSWRSPTTGRSLTPESTAMRRSAHRHFDRVAREGARFTHAFVAAPSCTPSRAALLTGQAVHRLEEGGNLHGFLPKSYAVYPDLLEAAGYVVGHSGKGWGPGRFEPGGRTRNPAGPRFQELRRVHAAARSKVRRSASGSGAPILTGRTSRDRVRAAVCRSTGFGCRGSCRTRRTFATILLDYYFEVQRFDPISAASSKRWSVRASSSNTIVIVTSDNGMPFPRAKANVYDAGARVPLAIRWPGVVKPGTAIDSFVSLTDLAPTLLESAGLKPPETMTGRSLLPAAERRIATGTGSCLHRARAPRQRQTRRSQLSRSGDQNERLPVHPQLPAGSLAGRRPGAIRRGRPVRRHRRRSVEVCCCSTGARDPAIASLLSTGDGQTSGRGALRSAARSGAGGERRRTACAPRGAAAPSRGTGTLAARDRRSARDRGRRPMGSVPVLRSAGETRGRGDAEARRDDQRLAKIIR